MKEEKQSTDNCYLTYSDELEGGGYLTCIYNHKVGEVIYQCRKCKDIIVTTEVPKKTYL
jgi:hypothetical protein